MTAFHVSQQVRLVEAQRTRQREIGDTVGRVHEAGEEAVQVLWLTKPMHRAWHKATDLEPSP